MAKLVDGVTKLSKMEWQATRPIDSPIDDQAMWAENMRKMFLAMAEDIRVVLIKLADRLHNMQTLDALSGRKAQADRPGDDGHLRAAGQPPGHLADQVAARGPGVPPSRAREVPRDRQQARSRAGNRARSTSRVVVEVLEDELKSHGLKAEISGRPKHIYSISRKMQRRSADIGQIYDLLAVRVLVESVPECYTVLGVVHALWRPLPGQFDDYIASPKESLYQSLHTTVLSLDGRPLEIQIRTHEMHQVAEYGVAAHWRYKEGRTPDLKFDAKVAWLRQLMDWQKDVVGGAQEFVDSLKTDVFQDQVYVFTPKGEIKELPTGATPLDFAYRIHTDVGHKCVGAKVNGRMVSLDYRLQNGDIVEIITARGSKGPSRDWLNPNLGYINTANAREKIRQWFRRQQREENIARGRELVEKELKRLGLTADEAGRHPGALQARKAGRLPGGGWLRRHPSASDLDEAGYATRQSSSPTEIPLSRPIKPADTPARGIRVLGVGDLLTRLARCCNPVPGDEIIGFITRGKGVTVHRVDCQSVLSEDEKDRLVGVDWGRTDQQVFPVTVRVEAWDREGSGAGRGLPGGGREAEHHRAERRRPQRSDGHSLVHR